MKVKTKKLKPNPMLASREQRTKNIKQKTENGKRTSVVCHLTSVFCLLSCVVLFFAGVAISSEQEPAVKPQAKYLAPRFTRGLSTDDESSHMAKPDSQSTRQLWQSRISVPQSEKNNKYRDELRRLIAQIRSIKFEPKNQEPKPVIAIEPVPTTEPNETESPTEVLQEHTEKKAEPQPDSVLPYEPVSEQTLQMLKNVSQQPDQLHNPLELADILFLSGNLKQATTFYQQALNRKDPNDVTLAQNKAWILFQIGNCLRDDDLPAATKIYRQLIAEYLNSPWTDLAKARQNLIDWYLNDKPQTLIAESKSCLSAVEGMIKDE